KDGDVSSEAEREKMQVVITGGRMTVKDGSREEAAEFTIDPGKKPATIDIRPKGEKVVVQGIYQLDGDELSLCFGLEGKDRPAAFESKKKSGTGLLVLRRKK